jgi:adenylate cyclase
LLEILLGVVTLYAIGVTVIYFRTSSEAEDAHEDQKAQYSQRQAQMESTIEAKADEAMRLHQTFRKFVPRQFVDHFAKSGSDSLELGRAAEDKVAILFCDIRGFTSLSERLSPQDLMYFLNSYFMRMNAPIHQNNGFIDKFIGDAIMALFDNPQGSDEDKAADAVTAAMQIQTALTLYNGHRANSKYPPVKNGIGLHFGNVVLGTVGSDDRMDTTVIGDTVNIAQRIESLSSYFNADVLASESTLLLANKKQAYAYRLLDHVRFKGKSVDVPVVEILDHLPSEIQAQKLEAAQGMKVGMHFRDNDDIEAALAQFENLTAKFPNDAAITHHVAVCNKALLDKNWDGLVRI